MPAGATLGNTFARFRISSTGGLSFDGPASDGEVEDYMIEISAANQPPVADAGGPYTADPGETITLDGTGSYDPDGVISSYTWDLDNDGEFDDSSNPQPSFTVGGTPGAVYPVCLKVVDDSGLDDFACTSVTVVTSPQPPAVDVSGTIQPANKLMLLTPWITLSIVLAALATVILIHRRIRS